MGSEAEFRASGRCGVGLAGQDAGFKWLQEDIVERQSERNVRSLGELGHIGPWQQRSDLPRGR